MAQLTGESNGLGHWKAIWDCNGSRARQKKRLEELWLGGAEKERPGTMIGRNRHGIERARTSWVGWRRL